MGTLKALSAEQFSQIGHSAERVDFQTLQACMGHLRVTLLGAESSMTQPNYLQAYAMMTACSGSHRLALNEEEFEEFIYELLKFLLSECAEEGETIQSAGPCAVPSVGLIQMSIVTIGGETLQVEANDKDTTEVLR